ncbi:MAG: glutamine amidotransferase, partial [Myxococcota bacterium]
MRGLLEQHPEFNDWQLAFLTPLPVWLLVLLVAGLVVAVVTAHLGLAGETRRRRRLLLTGLRAVAAACALFLVLEPAIQLLQVHRIKNRVAVLLDTSGSMALPTEGEKTRLQSAQQLLEQSSEWFQQNSERFVFDYATYDSDTYPAELGRLLAVEEAGGLRTDIMAALRSAAGGSGGRRLAGVLLLSDGVDTEALRGGLGPDAARELEELGAPIHVFAAGGEDDLADIAITRILSDDFAFVRSAIEVEVVVRSRGLAAQEVPMVLRREGRVVSTQNVHLEPDEEKKVAFRFTPDTTGKYVYTVEVPVLQEEAIRTNNRRSFVLKVIRDRIRVLQVAGRPSWDQRFLRGLLKKDPNVDLISFFILRTPENTRNEHQPHNDELSLIPFPTHELFTEELDTFDLVVFQNFDYMPYQMAQYLGNVRRYVEDGGSFVMIGGEKSFSEGRYQGTYIEDILPVELLPSHHGTVDSDPFQPRLTEDGLRHPITQVGGGESVDRIFAKMPDLPGINMVRRARPDAQVLLEHPFRRGEDGSAPVVVAGEFGRGRTMAVTTDG